MKMTNLFTKLKNTIIADLNEVLDQKEKQNPIAMLNHYLNQCEQETDKVRKLVERQYRLKDEFTREYNQAVELAEKRKRQSEIASKAGETELYKFATGEHQQYAERAQRLLPLISQVSEEIGQLEGRYEEMKQKLKDMQLRRLELMGRENVTRANLRMNQVLEPNSYSDQTYSKFKDIENYLDGLEHKVNNTYYRSTIDARVAQIEKEVESKSEVFIEKSK